MYDVYKIREQFPMLKEQKYMQGKPLVFLDNASTTFKPQCVIDAITKYYAEETSNSHRGDYDLCYKMDLEIENTRKAIARFINCGSNEVVFTSGDTMALNLIAWGYGHKFLKAGDEVRLVGFGTFAAKKRAAREGINPLTKEAIKIPAKTVASFKAGSKLKDALN